MERSFDLKDALRNGVNPEQMLADFQKQLAQAQQEVAMEQAAATEDLDKARANMANSVIDYLIAMGFVDKDVVDTDDMANDFISVIKEAEQEFAATKPLLDMLKKMKVDVDKHSRTPEVVIGEFLKTLR